MTYNSFIVMAKLADAADLKSAGLNRPWGFKSPSGHQSGGAICGQIQAGVTPVCRAPVKTVTGQTRMAVLGLLANQRGLILSIQRNKSFHVVK